MQPHLIKPIAFKTKTKYSKNNYTRLTAVAFFPYITNNCN